MRRTTDPADGRTGTPSGKYSGPVAGLLPSGPMAGGVTVSVAAAGAAVSGAANPERAGNGRVSARRCARWHAGVAT